MKTQSIPFVKFSGTTPGYGAFLANGTRVEGCLTAARRDERVAEMAALCGTAVPIADQLVDAIGKALGVDTGTVGFGSFEMAVEAAARVLEGAGLLPTAPADPEQMREPEDCSKCGEECEPCPTCDRCSSCCVCA